MSTEVRCWCRHCKVELSPDHKGPCPKCGKLGKDCKVIASAVVGIKASVSATHKPNWSGTSFTLFFGLVAILLSVISYGILTLLPFSSGVNYGILVGFLLVVVCIFWWQRYHVLMLIRKLEDKLGGEKKYKSG